MSIFVSSGTEILRELSVMDASLRDQVKSPIDDLATIKLLVACVADLRLRVAELEKLSKGEA